ncbi:sugar transferase [Shimia thalassica]|uniref:sugar transferase n=1 Tax=Shimia thalassica TaxID=1715693 RepID=UPI00249461D7|nr:sugar transferase [Shimia thalassica]
MTMISEEGFENSYSAAPEVGGVYRVFFKRLFDILFVCLIALPVLTIVAGLAVVIFLKDRKNPFYLQSRVGLDGIVFKMVKLRTMVPNADKLLDDYLASNQDAREEWDHHQKLKNDPRITNFGRFLRRSSMDELPQFFNVLIGDMSVVGPRPMMVDQVELYPGEEYFNVRPGITGFWQTSERNVTSFAERAYYDTQYDRSLSLGTDLTLIFRTVKVVLHGTGV